jgi:hypothetical protein
VLKQRGFRAVLPRFRSPSSEEEEGFLCGFTPMVLSNGHNIPHAKGGPADTLVVLINRAK